MRDIDYDILIVGAGMAGASLACALDGAGYRIALLEASSTDHAAPPGYDERVLALAYGSQRIFRQLGVWDALAEHATPIEHIHVSDRGRFGFTRLHAVDEGVPAMGYVTPARAIGEALLPRLPGIAGLEVLRPATVVALAANRDGVEVGLITGQGRQRLRARLLVAADGVRSAVRELSGIGADEHDYSHTAIIANLTPAQGHGNVAYERFTETGPLALLPMTEGRMSLVYTVHSDEADAHLGLDDAAFLCKVQERFGYRLGRLQRIGQRSAYPLVMTRAQTQIAARTVLIGNAAHTLHPIGGQGFNLGLRDVATLAAMLRAPETHDPGAGALLAEYAKRRAGDHSAIIRATDALAKVFSNRLPVLSQTRDLGMIAVDLLSGPRHLLARHAMGLAARVPTLEPR
ncbi:MAG: 2-octaprenyl-6-methoxyphenyl hydroxylase [Gammaproteobacteria bacterium]|nr:2-octaprenyl-6-methoxyphenyl hydroxylase [Gammaproteobacteria bacterium]MCP5136984.1 2-octaprenyl-6-methoxyphenyl hydroxylase [Gammaproteobacteria bacterium]